MSEDGVYRIYKPPRTSDPEKFKDHVQHPLSMPYSLVVDYDKDNDLLFLTDDDGFIYDREIWKEIKKDMDIFYEALSDEFIKQYNDNVRRRQEEKATKSTTPDPVSKNKKESKNKGYIYVLKGNGCYKIGKSKNPDKRTERLEVKLPFEVNLDFTIQSDYHGKLEEWLHKKFDDKRLNGEWFDLSKEDLDFIRNLDGNEWREDQ